MASMNRGVSKFGDELKTLKIRRTRSGNPEDKIPGGNLTLFEVAEVAKVNQRRVIIPPSLIVGSPLKQIDKKIWTDPSTGKVKVVSGVLDQAAIKAFIDDHLSNPVQENSSFNLAGMSQMKKRDLESGVVAPRFIMKKIKSHDRSMRYGYDIFYSKAALLEAMNDARGEYDVIVQQYIIQKSFKPAIYRFYRNEKNIYKAECITNSVSPLNAFPGLREVFEKTLE